MDQKCSSSPYLTGTDNTRWYTSNSGINCNTTGPTYGPPFVGNQGDAFRRSSLYDIPPLAPAPPRPRRGHIQNIPPCWDKKRLQSSVPHHIAGSEDSHWVFRQSFYVGLVIVQYVLLRKHLGTIPSNIFIPDNTSSAWNRPQQGNLRHLTICQLRRLTQPVPALPFGDRCLPLLPPPLNGNWHSQLAPWLTPLRFSKEFPDMEGEDQGGKTPGDNHCRELHSIVQARSGDTCPQACHVMNQNAQGLTGQDKLEENIRLMITRGIHGYCL